MSGLFNKTNLEQISKDLAWTQLAIVTVCYQPDIDILIRQIRALPFESLKVIIDNDSHNKLSLARVEAIVPNVLIQFNRKNIGLAAAINQGVYIAHKNRPAVNYVLLMDQDTIPHPYSVDVLYSHMINLEAQNINVGAVGPLLIDPESDLSHGFHQMKNFFYLRQHPTTRDISPMPCVGINGSGTLTRVDTFYRVKGLEEDLFIDHVDTEWSFRLKSFGYSIFGVPTSIFEHRMGEKCLRFWFFGWRLWPLRSPERHYFLFRNTVRLLKRAYIPYSWKFWASIKLLITIFLYLTIKDNRKIQLHNMISGFAEGLRNH